LFRVLSHLEAELNEAKDTVVHVDREEMEAADNAADAWRLQGVQQLGIRSHSDLSDGKQFGLRELLGSELDFLANKPHFINYTG
jgi:hypothetical protein